MGGQLLLSLLLTALRQLPQTSLEIGIPAGIAFHTEPGCLLHKHKKPPAFRKRKTGGFVN